MPSFNDVYAQITGGQPLPGNVQANRAGAFNSIAASFHPGQYAQVNAQIATRNPSNYTDVPSLNQALKGGQINKQQWQNQFRVIQNKTNAPPIKGGLAGAIGSFGTAVNKVGLGLPMAGVSGVRSVSDIVRGAAASGDYPGGKLNATALANAQQAKQRDFPAFVSPFTRPLVQAAESVVHPFSQHSYTPQGKNQQEILGNTPIQNINKGVASTYTAHKGMNPIVRVALAGGYGLGQAAQDVGIGSIVKSGGLIGGLKAAQAKLGPKEIPSTLPTKSLTSYEGAPDTAKVAQYKAQLQAGKPIEPLIVKKDSLGNLGVEDGKHRLEAARQLGIKDVPVTMGKTPAIDALKTNPALGERGAVSLPSTNDYVKQQIKLQDAARTAGDPGKIKGGIAETKRTLVDSLSGIEDTLHQKVTPQNAASHITPQLDRAIRGDYLGADYIKKTGLAKVIQSAPNTKELDQYLIAKHAADLEKNGIQTGRNLPADQQLIKDLGPKYEAHAQAIKEYSNNLLDTATNYGLVSKDLASHLKQKYPNYVPVNRIFGEGELPNPPKGVGQGMASLGSQSVVQKIKGSTRQIESPLSNLVDKTVDVVKQGERNKAAQILTGYHTLPGNPFDITPLRTAENVKARIDVFSQAKELKPVQNQLNRLISSRGKWARQLQSQLDQLNKKGLQASLAKSTTKTEAPILTGQAEVLKGVKVAQSGRRSMPVLTGTAGHHQLFTRSMTAQETKNMVNNLLNMPDKEVAAINRKIANRDSTLKPIMAQLDDLRTTVEGIKNNRQALLDEGRLLRDAESRGKTTISAMRNGIKEIYETTPEIATAAQSLNKEQLGLVGRILFRPATRVLRLGATGLNPAFAIRNVAKDTVSAFINSRHSLRASVANPEVFVQALKAAANHGSKEYTELVRQGAGGTSFDIARNAPKQNVRAIRMQRNLPSRVAYTVTNPAQLLRAAENTIGRSEEFNRAIQYFGNKQAALKKGVSMENAVAYGAHSARNNTVNFARAGDWGKVLNSTFPYLNAGVQGSRTLVRNLKEYPAQTTAKLALTTFFPTAVITAWNVSDPKRKAAYDDIKQYEKDGNMILVPPNPVKDAKTGKWNVIKIPVSQEIANLNNVVRNGVEASVKDRSLNLAQMLGNTVGAVTSVNAQSPRALANQFTPQALKPGLESLVNQNLFTGNKIVPDSQRNLPGKDQIGPGTSKTATKIGQITGLSPRHIDNAISTSAGGLGKNVVHGKSLSSQITGGFNGAQGNSPYDLANTRFNTLKSQLTNLPDYKSMSSQDKAKALNRLQSAVNGALAPQPGKKLSGRQQAIVNKNPDLASYLKAKR